MLPSGVRTHRVFDPFGTIIVLSFAAVTFVSLILIVGIVSVLQT